MIDRRAELRTWRSVDVNDTPTSYLEVGTGPTLVFWHGWGLDDASYRGRPGWAGARQLDRWLSLRAGVRRRYARGAPALGLGTARSGQRVVDVLSVLLADLHRAGHSTVGHLNDAFLGGVTGGLRRYHEKHGAEVDELRVTRPISLRRPGDPPGGNLITLVRLAVPAGLPDPAERMAAIAEVVERWRAEPALALTQPIAMALNLLPAGVVGGMLKHVDFLASNVPGFPIPIFLAAAQVEAYYPFGPTIGASVNLTLLSYGDTCCVGVSCDPGAIPDPELLMQCLRDGFDEVLDLGGDHTGTRLPAHPPLEGAQPWKS